MNPSSIAALIDHTNLKPETTRLEIEQLCREAREHGFFSVCVNSMWIPYVSESLKGSAVKTCSVVGFPLGAMCTPLKAAEARWTVQHGAHEVDMVIPVGALKARERAVLLNDIRAVVEASHEGGAIVKVIIETALLTDEEKQLACALAVDAGAEFVKTSTGFSRSGATPEDVALMRGVVGPDIGVKASGGIRTLADLERMVAAGASRIGASAGISILREALA